MGPEIKELCPITEIFITEIELCPFNNLGYRDIN
jgi:hypothetical protein